MPGLCSELYVSYLFSSLPQPRDMGVGGASVLLCYPHFLDEETEAQERSIIAPGPQPVRDGARTPGLVPLALPCRLLPLRLT